MTERFEIDPAHTMVGFSVKHLAVSTVRGSFGKFEGAFEADRDNWKNVSGELKIETASITTGNEQRDGHLQSGDFFEAEKFPYITFKVKGVDQKDLGNYQVSGDLTIKDVTRPVTLAATVEGEIEHPFKPGSQLLSISATGELNRKDFSLNWDGLAGAIPMAGHQIKLHIDAEVTASPVTAEVTAQA